MAPGSSSLQHSSSSNMNSTLSIRKSAASISNKASPPTSNRGSSGKKKKSGSGKFAGSQKKRVSSGENTKSISPRNKNGSGKTQSTKTVVPSIPAPKLETKKPDKNISLGTDSETDDVEVTFKDYSTLCERVAKTMYYANPVLPQTPRPSLPLTSKLKF